jgi:hypothetical protein
LTAMFDRHFAAASTRQTQMYILCLAVKAVGTAAANTVNVCGTESRCRLGETLDRVEGQQDSW